MQVKGIPLPADAESRGMDWPCSVEPTAAELAAIEVEMPALLAEAEALFSEAEVVRRVRRFEVGDVIAFGRRIVVRAA
jgi:hypothetical protein